MANDKLNRQIWKALTGCSECCKKPTTTVKAPPLPKQAPPPVQVQPSRQGLTAWPADDVMVATEIFDGISLGQANTVWGNGSVQYRNYSGIYRYHLHDEGLFSNALLHSGATYNDEHLKRPFVQLDIFDHVEDLDKLGALEYFNDLPSYMTTRPFPYTDTSPSLWLPPTLAQRAGDFEYPKDADGKVDLFADLEQWRALGWAPRTFYTEAAPLGRLHLSGAERPEVLQTEVSPPLEGWSIEDGEETEKSVGVRILAKRYSPIIRGEPVVQAISKGKFNDSQRHGVAVPVPQLHKAAAVQRWRVTARWWAAGDREVVLEGFTGLPDPEEFKSPKVLRAWATEGAGNYWQRGDERALGRQKTFSEGAFLVAQDAKETLFVEYRHGDAGAPNYSPRWVEIAKLTDGLTDYSRPPLFDWRGAFSDTTEGRAEAERMNERREARLQKLRPLLVQSRELAEKYRKEDRQFDRSEWLSDAVKGTHNTEDAVLNLIRDTLPHRFCFEQSFELDEAPQFGWGGAKLDDEILYSPPYFKSGPVELKSESKEGELSIGAHKFKTNDFVWFAAPHGWVALVNENERVHMVGSDGRRESCGVAAFVKAFGIRHYRYDGAPEEDRPEGAPLPPPKREKLFEHPVAHHQQPPPFADGWAAYDPWRDTVKYAAKEASHLQRWPARPRRRPKAMPRGAPLSGPQAATEDGPLNWGIARHEGAEAGIFAAGQHAHMRPAKIELDKAGGWVDAPPYALNDERPIQLPNWPTDTRRTKSAGRSRLWRITIEPPEEWRGEAFLLVGRVRLGRNSKMLDDWGYYFYSADKRMSGWQPFSFLAEEGENVIEFAETVELADIFYIAQKRNLWTEI